jgi:Phage integrase family
MRHDDDWRPLDAVRPVKPGSARRPVGVEGCVVAGEAHRLGSLDAGCEGASLVYVLNPRKHGLRFHDLRHTCAAMLIAEDAHPKAIQDHLGHKDIQTTFNVYGHLLPSVHDALGASLDAAYEGSADQRNVVAITSGTGARSDSEGR